MIREGEGTAVKVGDKRTGPFVACRENYALHTGMDKCARAHDAWLQGYGHDGPDQPVVLFDLSSFAKTKNFRMTSRVIQGNWLIVCTRDEGAVRIEEGRADWRFFHSGGLACFLKSRVHERAPTFSCWGRGRDRARHEYLDGLLSGQVFDPGFEHLQSERHVRIYSTRP